MAIHESTEARAAELLLRLEAELRTPLVEALEQIAVTARKARRTGRQAKPIPQSSFDACLELIEHLAKGPLIGREPGGL